MWRLVDLVRNDVSEEHVSFFRVERIRELGTTIEVTNKLKHIAKKLNMETCSSETSVLTRPARRHIPEDGICHEEWRLVDLTPCGSCKNRRFGGT
jgi:hypothetical protein